jgi:DNA invertase Pin-like site-specific DNA recombinase
MAKALIPAFAYLRTSSAANVGPDKDSDRRQRDAVTAFAKRAGYELAASDSCIWNRHNARRTT